MTCVPGHLEVDQVGLPVDEVLVDDAAPGAIGQQIVDLPLIQLAAGGDVLAAKGQERKEVRLIGSVLQPPMLDPRLDAAADDLAEALMGEGNAVVDDAHDDRVGGRQPGRVLRPPRL
jgi:hypothetical protein